MQNFKSFKSFKSSTISTIFTDIDDTLTDRGKLPAQAYAAIWTLHDHGKKVVPVTGRPAGWCEMIARLWPVSGVIGENGAFYFAYKNKKMHRNYHNGKGPLPENRTKLDTIAERVFREVPEAGLASDQFTRLFDLAIDFCEDVAPLQASEIEKIVRIFADAGAQAKVSSIHVNGWFGEYNKLSMCKQFVLNEMETDFDSAQVETIFIGDSLNDEPMFGGFKNSVAVANIRRFEKELKEKPKFITTAESAKGFVEFANHLVSL